MPIHDWTRADPNDYHDFHGAWIYAIRTARNLGILPPGYFALADHVVPPVVPDVITLQRPDPPNGTSRSGGGAAVAATGMRTTTAAPPHVRFTTTGTAKRPPRSQRRIVIGHTRNRRMVAVIGLVSPTNKSKRSEFRQFVEKVTGLLRQNVHALVIDPFPPTARDPGGVHPAIWKALVRRPELPALDKPLTLASYAATEDGFRAFVEPVAVGDPLPEMPLFLEPDQYVNVPLEATYQTAWAGFPAYLRGLVEDRP